MVEVGPGSLFGVVFYAGPDVWDGVLVEIVHLPRVALCFSALVGYSTFVEIDLGFGLWVEIFVGVEVGSGVWAGMLFGAVVESGGLDGMLVEVGSGV